MNGCLAVIAVSNYFYLSINSQGGLVWGKANNVSRFWEIIYADGGKAGKWGAEGRGREA